MTDFFNFETFRPGHDRINQRYVVNAKNQTVLPGDSLEPVIESFFVGANVVGKLQTVRISHQNCVVVRVAMRVLSMNDESDRLKIDPVLRGVAVRVRDADSANIGRPVNSGSRAHFGLRLVHRLL